MLKLEQITAYKISSELSDEIWQIVDKWPYLAKKTIGDQLVRSIDSVAANIAEGEGRFFKKEKIKFYYNAQGSLYESAHWIEKAKARGLITDDQYEKIISALRILPKQIRFLIANASKKLLK